jgi:hypothetical protein
MDFEALKATIQTVGIHAVRVEQEDGIFPSSKRDPRVVGSLDDYLAALTALKAPIVLVYTRPLEEDDFLYSSSGREAADDEAAEEGEGETPEIDLCKVNPALTAFKEHVRSVGTYLLTSPLQGDSLDFLIEEPWYQRFKEGWEVAVTVIDEAQAAEASRMQLEEEDRLADVIAAMDGLAEDKKFARLPTQKAMLQYALDKIPGLSDIDVSSLRMKIQDLKARIDARSI